MSDISGSSDVEGGGRRNPNEPFGPFYCAGIPDFCWCGEEAVMITSKSDKNPYRRFFRCERAASEHMVNDNHAFKWMDEAYYDELKLITKRIRKLEDDVKQKLLEMKEEVTEHILEGKAELSGMNIASENRIHEEGTIFNGIVTHFSDEISAMERKWKKKMLIVCCFYLIAACIIKAI